MLIYYFVWFILLIPRLSKGRLLNQENFNKRYAWYAFVVLSLLLGLRADTVGTDTSQYDYLYKTVELRIGTGYDLGYYLFSNIFHKIGFSYQTYLFVISCIMIGCLVLYYDRYSRSLGYSLFIFMTIGLLPMYMSGLRQSMAISLCLLALILLEKRRYILAAAVIALAYTFHASAIVAFVLLPLSGLRLSRKNVTVLIILSSMTVVFEEVLLNLAQMVLPEKYEDYDILGSYDINPLLLIIAVLIPLFCVIFDYWLEADRKYSREKSLLYIMSCINIIFMMLAVNSMYFSRVAYYFVHANSILIPNVIFSQRSKYNRIIMATVITVICMLYFMISIPDGTMQIDKYQFFWQ